VNLLPFSAPPRARLVSQLRGVGNRSIFRQSLCVKELPVIYGEQAAAFMEFVSAEYEARDWTPG
jgi:hypothetical protein